MGERMAVMRFGGSLSVADVLMLELPHFSAENREYALWEYTGFPCFFTGDPHPITQLRQQLRDVREGRALTTDQLYDDVMKSSHTQPRAVDAGRVVG